VLSFFESEETISLLFERMNDDKDHIYIRLEAASSLLKMGHKDSLGFFQCVLYDDYLANRLEAVIILGEIEDDDACNLLIETLLDPKQHPEIRAGAAWSLGELKNRNALDALVRVFNEVEDTIRAEAARALMKFGDRFSDEITRFIPDSNEDERAGLAWALSKSGSFKIHDLLPVMNDNEARKWVAWIIGTQDEAKYIDQIEKLKSKDQEVYFAVTVLWKILSSWIEGLDVY
jgi:HEAT repeat protein